MDIHHEPDHTRFAVATGHGTAELAYRREGDRITFIHTGVPEGAQGQGIGSALAEAGLTFAREQGLEVVPACAFVAAYVREHSEWDDLLADGA